MLVCWRIIVTKFTDMIFARFVFHFLTSLAVFTQLAHAKDIPPPNPLPYDYEVAEKCDREILRGKVCEQIRYYSVAAFGSDLRAALLAVEKSIWPDERSEQSDYAPLGSIGQADVWIGTSSPDNVAKYVIFTLIDGKLVDHRLIGVDNLEIGSVTRDFLIDKNYRFFVYSRKPNTGIKSPRKLIGSYQIQADGKIVALK